MTTVRLTTSQALFRFLDNQYINYDGEEIKYVKGIAGIFGHGCVLGIGEALEKIGDDFKFYRVNNEQGAGHFAVGFAKQNNRKQILCATSSVGPGAMNMVTAAATATANRIPALFLPGDIYASRQPDPVLQQVEQEHSHSISSNDAFKPVSKYWDRIVRPEQLMSAVINAMRVLTDPALTGAVTLSLPQDTAAEVYDYPVSFFRKRVHLHQRRPLAPGFAEEIAEIIAKKKKPMMLVGGGTRYSEAWEEVEAFATEFNIPFAETQAGKGIISWDHDFNLGGMGTTGTLASNRLAKDTDCLIAVGTRLNDFHTASKWAYQNPDLTVIGINVNPMDAYKLDSIPVLADAKLALSEIHSSLKKIGYKSAYTDEIAKIKQEWNDEVDRLFAIESQDPMKLAQTKIIGMMNNGGISDDAIVVCASGSLPSDMERIWRPRSKHSYHLEYAYSCMGYEIPGAIGAKLAEPERDVWVLMGDGTYLMYHQEIVMAIQEGIKINIVVVDNGGWQCIDNLQTGQGIPRFGCELRFRNENSKRLDGDYVPIDFAMNGKSYGCDTWSVSNPEQFFAALKEAGKSDKCTVIDVKSVVKSMTDGYETWWRAGTPELSETKAVMEASEVMQKHLAEAKKY